MKRPEPTLLNDERTFYQTKNQVVQITSHRVVFNYSAYGKSELIFIPLSRVSSCGLVTNAHPSLLYFGLALFAAAVYADGFIRFFALFWAALSVLLYIASRQSVLSVSANGGHTITVPRQQVSESSAIEVMNFLMMQIARHQYETTGSASGTLQVTNDKRVPGPKEEGQDSVIAP